MKSVFENQTAKRTVLVLVIWVIWGVDIDWNAIANAATILSALYMLIKEKSKS